MRFDGSLDPGRFTRVLLCEDLQLNDQELHEGQRLDQKSALPVHAWRCQAHLSWTLRPTRTTPG